MRPSIPLLLAGVTVATFLHGCGEAEDIRPVPVRPVKIFVVEGADNEAKRRFPAVVRASQRAELGFRVPGVLQEMVVREGDNVEAGQTIARLDPTDFNITLADRKATFENARSNFNRAKELIVDGNISKLDFDRMEANFKTTRAALAQAQQDLDYTELKAPFKGRIGERLVDNFEEVLAKQTIYQLQDLSQLDLVVNLSESLVRSLQPSDPNRDTAGDENDRVDAFAEFDDRGERYRLAIKEVATKADDKTQTFRVTLTMAAPTSFSLLPGMTTNVSMDFSRVTNQDAVKWVPATAVVADSELDARVWVLNADSMTVSQRQVTIGRLSGSRIQITGGLGGGEEIVSVGADYLAEGMEVTRMRQTEQAVQRDDDPS